jgi:hypothetical protein
MCRLQSILSPLAYDQAGANKSLVEAIVANDACVTLLGHSTALTSAFDAPPLGHSAAPPPAFAAARSMLEAERRRVPLLKLLVLLALFAWLLASQTLATHNVACGSAAYWLLVLSVAPAVVGLMACVRPYLIEKVQVKKEVCSMHVQPACVIVLCSAALGALQHACGMMLCSVALVSPALH